MSLKLVATQGKTLPFHKVKTQVKINVLSSHHLPDAFLHAMDPGMNQTSFAPSWGQYSWAERQAVSELTTIGEHRGPRGRPCSCAVPGGKARGMFLRVSPEKSYTPCKSQQQSFLKLQVIIVFITKAICAVATMKYIFLSVHRKSASTPAPAGTCLARALPRISPRRHKCTRRHKLQRREQARVGVRPFLPTDSTGTARSALSKKLRYG